MIELQVQGMTCGACTSAVTSALEAVPGVQHVDVSLVTERAVVQFDGDPNVLVSAVEDSGFDAQIAKSTTSEPVKFKINLSIEGMTCGSCTSAVQTALKPLPFVSAEVSLPTDSAFLEFEGSKDSMENAVNEAVSAIFDAGFDASIGSIRQIGSESSVLELKLFGPYTPEICSKIASMPGIISCDLQSDLLTALYNSELTGVRAVIRELESHGLSALVAASADNSQQLLALNRVRELQRYYRNTIQAFVLGVPVIFISKFPNCVPKLFTATLVPGLWVNDVICFVLVVPLLLCPARAFYRKAWRAMLAKSPNMDVLVTISTLCAFVYSVFALIYSIASKSEHHQMYLWDACAMILMFVLLGKYLENVARGQTSKALSDLISLVPEKSLVVASDTEPQGTLLPTDLLQINDEVVLRPGERVAADGEVVSGDSFVSEAMITGEARPVRKQIGDMVIGGTINGLGTLRFKVKKCGSETKLAQIVAFIKDAQASRAPIQRYADYAASRFVPMVLILSLSTFFGWMLAGLVLGRERLPMMFKNSLFLPCLRLGIAVVVVACPCALGLATPTAVMVGTGTGARFGILVKGGSTFERGAQSDVVLFDKTGTLTTGVMSVVATSVPAEHWPLVRALESLSEHPAGKAMAVYTHPKEPASPQLTLPVTDLEVHIGQGISGTIGTQKLYVGKHSNLKGIHVLVDGVDVGSITLKDSLRSDATAVVDALREQGMVVGVVSGDGEDAVEAVARTLGIAPELTWSGMRPEDKVRVVEDFRTAGREVVFVGDGINDSPALVAASVGVSLEGATHVAVESSDIVITQRSPISAVPAALDLCRCTMMRIKQNLFMSVVYNAVMIPFAMGLLLHFHLMLTPMMASAAMALSSISVVLSSLFLKLWSPPPLDSAEKVPFSTKLRQWFRGSQSYEPLPV